MTTTTERRELSLADLVARLRESVAAESAGEMPDPASPCIDRKKNATYQSGLADSFRAAAQNLTTIADDDYRGLASWCEMWGNVLANCCGRFGGSSVNAHRVLMAIYGGHKYGVIDGVLYESTTDRYERLVS